MAKKLTAAAVAKLNWRDGKPNEHSDAGCPGLRLAVFPSGKKSWIFRYRRPDTGAAAKFALGPVDVLNEEQDAEPVLGRLLTLAAARKLAADAARQVALGNDPGKLRQEAKTEIAARRKHTFEAAARDFIDRYSRPKNKAWRATATLLGLIVETDRAGEPLAQGHAKMVRADRRKGGRNKTGGRKTLVERWGDRPVSAIRKRDIVEALDEIVDDGAPYVALVTLACLKKMFRWLAQRDAIAINPAHDVGRPHDAKARQRALDTDEVIAFWRAAGRLDPVPATVFKLLLLLGQRKEEVRLMARAELDPQAGTWTIPAGRVKNKHTHLVPLSKLARELIAEMPRIGDRYVFASAAGRTPGRKAWAGMSKAKHQVDRLMLEELRKRSGDEKVQLTPWRIHDLRRTCSTGMAKLRVAPHVVEAVLNHRSGIISGVAAVYNVHSYEDEKLAALETWSRYVLSLADGTENNVTPFRQAAS